jgi:hypothetical protein
MVLGAVVIFASAGWVTPRALAARSAPPPPVVDDYSPTPGVECGPGSSPESTQGRIPAADYQPAADGGPTRAEQGYYCNAVVKGRHGESGGYRVHRYVDASGHECAFYDTTLLWPGSVASNGGKGPGVFVLDMSDPANPVHTATLATPAMQSPHESFSLNKERGLLAAGMGYPTFQPGFVDVYDVSQDCRTPVFQSSTPLGVLGHEGEFSPDGRTYWVTSLATNTIVAVDVATPMTPSIIGIWRDWSIHGLNISDDGTRFYGADLGSPESGGTDGSNGLTILDVSDVQNRVPNPQLRLVSHLTWRTVSTPQTAIPVTITSGQPARPHKFVIEVDEFGGGDRVGAARIVNIDDDANPYVVSNLRLEVNNPEAQAGEQSGDPGASSGLQGYDAHYCAVPQRNEPGIVACSFIVSGLRVFDIRDPFNPTEIAYANQAGPPGATDSEPSAPYAMSGPTFVPERGEIWYSDGSSGFYNVQITNGVWPTPTKPRKR